MPPNERFNQSNPPEIDKNQLFVYIDFIKPGKHEYLVSYEHVLVEPPPPPPPEPVKKKVFKK